MYESAERFPVAQDIAGRGLSLAPGARCGAHDPRKYLSRVDSMKRVFAKLAAQDP